MSTCTSCHASAVTPDRISHDTYCPGAVFAHWVVTDPAPESQEDYELACEAMHAANPHRFEGEL